MSIKHQNVTVIGMILQFCFILGFTLAQVKVSHFDIQNTRVSLRLDVENIGFRKKVSMITCNNQNCDVFPCRYFSGLNSSHEVWTCSSVVSRDHTVLTIRYQVSGRTFFDDGPAGKGYQLSFLVQPTSTRPSKPSETDFPFELNGCANWSGLDSCRGDQVDYPLEDEFRRWQTPSKGSPGYRPGFQSYRDLVGYIGIQYNASRTAATISVHATSRLNQTVECSFNQEPFTTKLNFRTTQQDTGPLTVRCRAGGATLEFDDTYFYWDKPKIDRPETEEGQKGAIAELYGWAYADIEKECGFLGKAGYLGVKIWPPNEHVMSFDYLEDGNLNPWYFVYQPVSYRLQSRQGTLAQLRSMIVTCRQNGVRVYADAVINHMSGSKESTDIKRSEKGGTCDKTGPKVSTLGSPYFTHSLAYRLNRETGLRPSLEFPAVPYGPTDFHCDRPLEDYKAGFIVTNGWLVKLTDLHTGKEYVRERIATYLATLLSVGCS